MKLRRSALRPAALVTILLACNGESLVLPTEGEPAAVAILQGNDQTGRVGEPLGQPIVALVTDSRGRPVAGVPVALTFGDGEATVEPSSARSGGDGSVAFQVVLGSRTGPLRGEVAILPDEGEPRIRAPVRLAALSADAAGLTLVAGDGQTGRVGAALAEPLVVLVADVFGNPIAGVPITWMAEGGGSVSGAMVETDAQGRSSVIRTLGPTAGVQLTRASAEGLAGSPVVFVHQASAGSAARLEPVSGDGQSAVVGTPLPSDLVVRLLDPEGNPVAGTAVAWVVGEGAGSLAPQTVPTDGEGRAASRWTLGGQAGTQRASGVVSGVGVVTFTATAVPGTPPGLRIATQPSATARRGIVLGRQPVVQLVEPSGGDLRQPGVPVTVSVAAGGGRARGTLTRTTDTDGRAAFTDLLLEGPAGRYTLAFGAADFTGAVSDPIELSRAPTALRIDADTPDPSAPGAAVRVAFTLTSQGGSPGGEVVVSLDDGTSCRAAVATGACSLTPPGAGSQRITARYAGDPEFEPASDTEEHVVEAAATALRIDSDAPDPSTPGEAVLVRFSLTSPAGTPPGEVTVSGGGASCTATAAQAGCRLVFADIGTYTIRADYPGDAAFQPSFDSEAHTVSEPAQRILTLRTQPSAEAVPGERLRRQPEIQLAVEGGGELRLGGVTVRAQLSGAGGTLQGTTAVVTGGDGRVRFSDLAITGSDGTYALVFSADGFRSVTSDPIRLGRTPTETQVTRDDPDPSRPGQSFEVRFRVRAGKETPTGSVTVSAGAGGPSCAGDLDRRGEGSCRLELGDAGEFTLTAAYPGTERLAPSSDQEPHRVQQ